MKHDLPRLTPDEQEALESFPHDAVDHWKRGEWFDSRHVFWRAHHFDSDRPEHYEFTRATGFDGKISREEYRCTKCDHLVIFSSESDGTDKPGGIGSLRS